MPPKHKKIIIDGNIFEGEDDPAYQAYLQRQRAAAAPPPQPRPAQPSQSAPHAPGHPAPGGGPGGGFNFSAPPLRVVEGAPGGLMGLPDLEIFGLRVSAVMVAILAFLTYQFGWKSLVAGAGMYYIWSANQGVGAPGQPQAQRPQPPNTQQQQQQRPGRRDDGVPSYSDMLGSLGLGLGSGGSSGAQQPSQQQQGQPPGQSGSGGHGPRSSWEGKGQGHKLGGN